MAHSLPGVRPFLRHAAALSGAAALASALALAVGAPSAAMAAERVVEAHPTGTGEEVRFRVSPSRPPAPGVAAAWARFFGGLPYGAELGSLTVDLVHLDEMRDDCGHRAGACYYPRERRAVIAGAGAAPAPNSVIADTARHEYGHHVATMANNSPWPRGVGPKRWFTTVRACQQLRSGRLVISPDESYRRSVVEGFAEAYRVMAGGSPHSWIVADELFPDRAARRALLEDLARPWTGNRTRTFSARLRRGATQRHRVRVPLDGRVSATVRPGPGLRTAVRIAAGSRTLAGGRGDRRTKTAATTACGVRQVDVLVRAHRGAGRYRVEVSTP
jgi:hypothetical protein